MAAENNTVSNAASGEIQDTTQSSKGKGKSPVVAKTQEDHRMEEDDESSSDEEPVSYLNLHLPRMLLTCLQTERPRYALHHFKHIQYTNSLCQRSKR